MDEHKQAVLQKRIEKTMKALERNKMKPFYAKDKGEALQIVQSLLQPGQTVTCGGSVTLSECGIIDLLRSGQYHYLDRDRPDLTPEQKKQIFRQAFSADVYLMSSNAVTEEGENGSRVQTYRELYDGSGQRISRTKESFSVYTRRNQVVTVGTKKAEQKKKKTKKTDKKKNEQKQDTDQTAG